CPPSNTSDPSRRPARWAEIIDRQGDGRPRRAWHGSFPLHGPGGAPRPGCVSRKSPGRFRPLPDLSSHLPPPPPRPATDRGPAARRQRAMDAFLHDLRQARRLFARAPGFALIAILTLGVGIGANTAIFSAIQGVLLRPVNAPDLDRIVVVGADFRELGLTDTWLTPREAADVVEREDLFSAAAALRMAAWSLTGAGDPVRVNGVETFGDFFGIFGVRPFLGRLFGPEQSTSGEHDVIVLGHGAWQRLTGGDPSIVGRTLYLDGVAREVIGVLPPGFDYPRGTEIYKPYPLTPAERQNLNNWL